MVLTRGLFQLNPLEVAIQLMVEDFTIFSQIETTEYIDKVFELKSRFGIPNLTKFEDLVNKVIPATTVIMKPVIVESTGLVEQKTLTMQFHLLLVESPL